jgi:hypothetical protein
LASERSKRDAALVADEDCTTDLPSLLEETMADLKADETIEQHGAPRVVFGIWEHPNSTLAT